MSAIPNRPSATDWLPAVDAESLPSGQVWTCALCGALADSSEASQLGPFGWWQQIDGAMYCPDCWHVCSGKECGHRPEDGQRCAQVNEKPRFSIECYAAGFARCPWKLPSVNGKGERGYACNLPDERGDECPRVQQAVKNRKSVLRVAGHGDEKGITHEQV